jgi:hypothetical protein
VERTFSSWHSQNRRMSKDYERLCANGEAFVYAAVSEGHVFSIGEQLLGRLWVCFHELTQRQVILLDHFVEIIYRSHLDITPIFGLSSNPEG